MMRRCTAFMYTACILIHPKSVILRNVEIRMHLNSAFSRNEYTIDSVGDQYDFAYLNLPVTIIFVKYKILTWHVLMTLKLKHTSSENR